MRMNLRVFSLLALLALGGAGIQAQDDPFGEVNIHKYYGSMTITSQVMMSGNVVTDAVVAVYCENELREKKSVGYGTNPNLVFLTVHGDYTGSYQYLYFKVFTDGHIFTYHPDPAIDFDVYYFDAIGTASNPYIIDITPVSLVNNADNSSVLTTYNNETCDVVLTGRTLYKDGDWNTLCLPFDVEDITGTPLEGATVKTLESTEFANGILSLTFSDALTSIQAGKPYLVKWAAQEPDYAENPVFENVIIGSITPANVETEYVNFVGTYSSVVFDAGTAHKDVLFLGKGSTLYYPDGSKTTTINACRAYFTLKGITAGDPANGGDVKGFVLNFDGEDDPDGLNEELRMKNEEFATAKGWYSLDGKKLDGKPTQRGIYIHNGKKVLY